jgi:S-methylmethionine-dependent homocysteine/selenocysteine methylase
MARRVFAVAVWLVTMFLLAACGKDGQLSLESYFERLEEIDNRSSERNAALAERVDMISEESLPDQERIDAARSAVPEFVASLQEFLAGLDKLEPPAEVRKEHEEALAAGNADLAYFKDLETSVAEAQSIAELDQAMSLLVSPEFTFADGRFTNSCLALQAAAEENHIDVSLACGGG